MFSLIMNLHKLTEEELILYIIHLEQKILHLEEDK